MTETESLTDRQKKLIYRANYRGTKEMDWLLGKYIKASVGAMDGTMLDKIEDFMELPDPQIENWLMGRDFEYPPEYADVIKTIRVFHEISWLYI